MNLFRDIKSKWLLHAKGLLFVFVGLFASAVILVEVGSCRIAFLLAVSIWCFCRFYYYLFYVLEKYAGRDKKYAGVMDALKFIVIRK